MPKPPLPKSVRLTVRGKLSPETEHAIRNDELVCEAHEALSTARRLLIDFQQANGLQDADDPTEEATLVLDYGRL